MAPAVLKKALAVATLLCLLVAWGAPSAYAVSCKQQCRKACKTTYYAEKKACENAYKAAEQLVKQQKQCCVDTACRNANYPGMTQKQCQQDAQNKHKANQNAKKACLDTAKMHYKACYKACKGPSPNCP